MFKRLLQIPSNLNQSFFLFGPRGVGKTSWIKKHFPSEFYFDLLNDDVYRELLGRPTRLGEKITEGYSGWVVLDEVQKIPDILNEVHRLIESRKLKFILTGSSARSLRRRGVNLLAGRALTFYLHPLTAIELGEHFDLVKSLRYGNLPMAVISGQPKKYLQSYIKTYLCEEVLQESLTRNIALFARFLEIASFSQGEILNYTEIAREMTSNRHTVSNYFDVLEDMLISYRLPVFRKRAKRDMITHPKFYFFDAGVYRFIRPQGILDSPAEINGPALETLFLQEARAINDYFELEYEFYYWRTRNQLEVDFVLYGNNGFCAFEIKRKEKPYSGDFIGLKEFKKDYPQARVYLLYNGNDDYLEGDVRVMPLQKAVRELPNLLNKYQLG